MGQPQQFFCTNCGQSLLPGTAFCGACGTRVSVPVSSAITPGQFAVGATPGFSPLNPQVPTQTQDNLFLAGLVANSITSRRGRRSLRQARRGSRQPGARLRGYGCLLLFLAFLVGPFIGVALSTGILHEIFAYVAVGIVLLVCVFILLGVLASRGGREALAEGFFEALLESLLGGR